MRRHRAQPTLRQGVETALYEFRASQHKLCGTSHRRQERRDGTHTRRRARKRYRILPHPQGVRDSGGEDRRDRHSRRLLSRRTRLPYAKRPSGGMDTRQGTRDGCDQRFRHGHRQTRRQNCDTLRDGRLARGLLSGGGTCRTRRQTVIRRITTRLLRQNGRRQTHSRRVSARRDRKRDIRSGTRLLGHSRGRRTHDHTQLRRIRLLFPIRMLQPHRLQRSQTVAAIGLSHIDRGAGEPHTHNVHSIAGGSVSCADRKR